MSKVYYASGAVREFWDDAATPRTVTFYNEAGGVVSSRPYTPEENAAADAVTAERAAYLNEQTMRDKARQAQTANATYLALASPTNAQNLAQIRALTRQVNALIKLELRDLADSSGT